MANERHARATSRVAIVTGGSRGIGRETIDRLASLGYAVVVNYVHDQRTAESTVEAVLGARGAAVAIRADVADDLDVETALRPDDRDVRRRRRRRPRRTGPRHRDSADRGCRSTEFDAMCRTNLRATFIVNRAGSASRSQRVAPSSTCPASVCASALPRYGGVRNNDGRRRRAHAGARARSPRARHHGQRRVTRSRQAVRTRPGRRRHRVPAGRRGHAITGHVLRLDHPLQDPKGGPHH